MGARLAAAVTLGVGLALTAAGFRAAAHDESERPRRAFQQSADAAEDRLVQWMVSSEHLLWGVRAVFETNPFQERDDFAQYVDALDLRRSAPGIQAVGFARWLPAPELPLHVAEVRRELPRYAVWPAGARDFYAPIVFAAPQDDSNLGALGFDQFSEPERRAAMRRACDEGVTALTGRVRLVQEKEGSTQAGVVMFAPVYRHGSRPATVEQRREALVGWAYVAFRLGDLMDAVVEPSWQVQLTLFDGAPEAGVLLYRSPGRERAGDLEAERPLLITGRPWTLVVRAEPRLGAVWSSRLPLITGLAGTGLSLAASLFVFASLTARRARAQNRRLLEAQARLEQSEKLFRSMSESSPMLLWTSSVDGRCRWVNQSWAEFTGLPREALLGDGWMSSVAEDDRARVLAWFHEVHAARRASQVEFRVRRADGVARWLLVIAVPQVDEHGIFSGFLGASVDVHEHHETEQRLADSELRLRLALKGGDLATWEVDLATKRLTFSERFATLLGLGAGANGWTMPQFLEQRVHPDDRASLESAALERLEDSTAPFRAELRLRHEDGHWVWVLLAGLVVRDRGVATRLSGTLMDISERKQAEEERRVFLERFTRAERAAALATLASGLAHEINNPLSVALTNTAWVEDVVDPALDARTRAEARYALDDVKEALGRVRDLVSELSALSSGASQRSSSELGRVLARAARAVEGLAPPGASIALELPSPDAIVVGGEGELVQLFTTLLTNAVQATSTRPNPVRVTATVEGERALVRVRDEGTGMTPEVLRRVFDPFFTTRAPGEGRGLGTTIAIAIARALGGSVEFERSDETGTTALVTLLLAR